MLECLSVTIVYDNTCGLFTTSNTYDNQLIHCHESHYETTSISIQSLHFDKCCS